MADDVSKCKCGEPGLELHPCPYLQDLWGNDAEICHCCEACVEDCRHDI